MKFNLEIFQEINNKKINYVVWKNLNLLEDFFLGNENIDIYVEYNDKEKFISLLKSKEWIEVSSNTNNLRDIKHFLFFSYDKVYHIHVYFKLLTGNSVSKNYDLTNLCDFFENKIFDDKFGLWIMDYKLQMLLFKIRLASKNITILDKYIVKRDLGSFKNEYSLLNKKLTYLEHSDHKINKILQKKVFNQKFSFLNEDQKDILYQIEIFKRKGFIKIKIEELIFLIRILYKKIFNLKKFKLKKQIIILITGPDSSGKTTILKNIKEMFSYYLNTNIFYIGKPYPKFLVNIFINNKYFIKKKQRNNKNENKIYLKSLRNLNLSFLRYLYSLKIFHLNKRNSILLLDRYVSENVGNINGPRIKVGKNKFLKTISLVERYFYKKIRPIKFEYRLETNLDVCIVRNNKRFKEVIKDKNEIESRYNLFKNSFFKVNKTYYIKNNENKKYAINHIIKLVLSNYNENY